MKILTVIRDWLHAERCAFCFSTNIVRRVEGYRLCGRCDKEREGRTIDQWCEDHADDKAW